MGDTLQCVGLWAWMPLTWQRANSYSTMTIKTVQKYKDNPDVLVWTFSMNIQFCPGVKPKDKGRVVSTWTLSKVLPSRVKSVTY